MINKKSKESFQILRNWTIKRNYIFKIKKLAKYLVKEINFFFNFKNIFNKKELSTIKKVIIQNIKTLISLLSKCLNKNILHKNRVIEKQKKLNKILVIFNK